MSEVERHYGLEQKEDPDPQGGGLLSAVPQAARQAADGLRNRAGDAYGQAADWAREQADRARGRYGDATDWASEQYGQAAQSADHARRVSRREYERGRDSVARFVDENPVMVGVAGLAAGLLLGALLPGTRRENAYFGRYADDVREQGVRYAQDLAQQGRELVEDNLRATAQARRERENGYRG